MHLEINLVVNRLPRPRYLSFAQWVSQWVSLDSRAALRNRVGSLFHNQEHLRHQLDRHNRKTSLTASKFTEVRFGIHFETSLLGIEPKNGIWDIRMEKIHRYWCLSLLWRHIWLRVNSSGSSRWYQAMQMELNVDLPQKFVYMVGTELTERKAEKSEKATLPSPSLVLWSIY